VKTAGGSWTNQLFVLLFVSEAPEENSGPGIGYRVSAASPGLGLDAIVKVESNLKRKYYLLPLK
jgi:hypothetical protein